MRDRPLFRGAAIAMLISGGSLATGFAVQVSLARFLGRDDYGGYAFAFGCVNIAVILCKFDLDTVATRFGGTHSSERDWGRFRTLARTLLLWAFGASLVVGMVAAALLLLFGGVMLADTRSVLLASLVILPPMTVLAVSAGLLQSMGRVVAAQFPTSIVRSVVFLGLVLLLAQATHALSAEWAVLANTVGTSLALLLSVVLLHRAIPTAVETPVVAGERLGWFRSARGALFVSVGQIVLSTQTDVVLLGMFTTKRESGFYSVASQLATLSLLGALAIQTVVGPRIAALHSAGDLPSLQKLVDTARRGGLLITLPLLALLVVGGPWILELFGPGFAEGSYPALVVLTLSMAISPLFGNMGGFLLTLTGHQDQAARIVGVSAVAYFAIALVLGPRYGPVGIATTTFLAYLLRAILLHRYAKRHIGIDLLGVAKQRVGLPPFV